jgi:hypothetical protein
MKRKLTIAAAFYRNDLPEGIGVEFRPTFGNDLQELMDELLTRQEVAFCKSESEGKADEYFNALLETIHAFARKKDSLSESEAEAVFSAIYILEKHKRIPSDEYNGCVFDYLLSK